VPIPLQASSILAKEVYENVAPGQFSGRPGTGKRLHWFQDGFPTIETVITGVPLRRVAGWDVGAGSGFPLAPSSQIRSREGDNARRTWSLSGGPAMEMMPWSTATPCAVVAP